MQAANTSQKPAKQAKNGSKGQTEDKEESGRLKPRKLKEEPKSGIATAAGSGTWSGTSAARSTSIKRQLFQGTQSPSSRKFVIPATTTNSKKSEDIKGQSLLVGAGKEPVQPSGTDIRSGTSTTESPI